MIDTLNFLFPRYCWICSNRLSKQEHHLCSSCIMRLPRTNYHLCPENAMEQLFWGSMNIVHAAAYFFYHQDSPTSEILYQLKYANCPGIGTYVAGVYAREIQLVERVGKCTFFADIDYIIPLPLSAKKKKKRGYNQCDAICDGLFEVTHIPIRKELVERVVSNSTQTKKSRVERGLNVEQIFRLKLKPEEYSSLQGKHILLVDDVCTTGATLKSFASVFAPIPDLKISILTLGLASPIF